MQNQEPRKNALEAFPSKPKGQKTKPEITGFERRFREEKAAPVLSLLVGDKDRRVGKKCPN